MTCDLENLLESIFYLIYHTGMQPSEVDRLYTYEMRRYVSYLRERLSAESESKSSIIGSLGKLLGLHRK